MGRVKDRLLELAEEEHGGDFDAVMAKVNSMPAAEEEWVEREMLAARLETAQRTLGELTANDVVRVHEKLMEDFNGS